LTRQPAPQFLSGYRRPDSGSERAEHSLAAIPDRLALQTASPFLERAPDGFGLGFPGEARHLRSEAFDFRVLEVQCHGYTMV
jgi:hypothetical protein